MRAVLAGQGGGYFDPQPTNLFRPLSRQRLHTLATGERCGTALFSGLIAPLVRRLHRSRLFDALLPDDVAGGDFVGEGLAEQFHRGVQHCVLVSSVVDAAHAVLAGDQAGGGEVF